MIAGELHHSAAMGTSAHDRHQAALARSILLYVFLGVLVPLWLLNELPERSAIEMTVFLSVAVFEYCALRLAWLAFVGSRRLMSITFFVFVYCWGGLAAFSQNYTWTFPWMVRHDYDHAFAGLVLICVAVLSYEAGRILSRIQGPHASRDRRFRVSEKAVFWIAISAVPLTALGIVMVGGPDVLFTTRGGFNRMVTQTGGSRVELAMGGVLLRSPSFVAFVLVSILCVRRWRWMSAPRKRLFLALLLGSAALFAVANFPLALSRQWLGTIVLTPLFALLPWRRGWAALLPAGLVLLVVFVYPYADAFRRSTTANSKVLDRVLAVRVVDLMLHKGDFDVYQLTLNSLVVVERDGIVYGRNLLGAAAFLVPRAVWAGKPRGSGEFLGAAVGYPYHQQNLSAPLWTEGYLAFGWGGTILIMALYGALSARLERAYVAVAGQADTMTISQLLVPFLAAYQFILMRGDLLDAVSFSSVTLVLFALAVRWAAAPTR